MHLLVHHGADPTTTNHEGWTPLSSAAYHGRVEAVRWLVSQSQHGLVVPVDQGKAGGETAMWLACKQGHVEVVQLLLEAGADYTLVNQGGVGPVAVAREEGNQDCVMAVEVGTWAGQEEESEELTGRQTP